MVSRVGFCCAITLIMLIMCLKHCTGKVRPKMRVTHPVHGLLNLLVDELLFIQVARDGTTNLRAKVVHCPQASLQTQSHTLLYMSTQTDHTHRYTCPSRQITHTAIHVHPDRSHTPLYMSIQTGQTHRYTCPPRQITHTTTHVHPDRSHTLLHMSIQTDHTHHYTSHTTTHVHPDRSHTLLHVTHHYTCPSRQVTHISDLSFLYLHVHGTSVCPSCHYLTCPECISPVSLHLPCPACI